MLRKHIQESSYLEAGVEGIVDQVVGPKIMQIEPEVSLLIFKKIIPTCSFLLEFEK